MVARCFAISSADIARCPKHSISARHFREDGSCRCDEREEAKAEVASARQAVREARERLSKARDWLEAM